MPELRKDPMIGRWVIIATERAKRPMDFAGPQPPETEPDCPFCEAREAKTPPEIFALRPADGRANSPGWTVRVVPSVNPILRIEGDLNRRAHGMYDVMNGIGAHEVIVESPQHIANAADLTQEQLKDALKVCVMRILDLERDPRFKYVLWFKNYGPAAGAGRIQHTRSQLIATPVIPKRVKEELAGSRRFFEDKERCLMCDLITQERDMKERIVLETPTIIALCPFAARFPFELMILPRRHHCDFAAMTPDELNDLSVVMKQCLARLKSVLADPPYNSVLHTAPLRRSRRRPNYWKTLEDDYHWHIELIPRLTRVAGFEWGSGFYINPTPPEEAARYLREAVLEPPRPVVAGRA
jgi:UDPglucose--hexose-1-phosphate uridylyltransferase